MRRFLAFLAFPLALGLAAAPGLAQGSCFPFPTATHLCLNGARFQAEVTWSVPGLGTGAGQAVPLTDDTGSFWFFDNSNLELMIKVLDGRAVNGHFWVFYGGLSDVEYRITVTDTATGVQEIYVNPAGRLASGSDVAAFNPEPPPVDPVALGPGLPEGVLPARLGPGVPENGDHTLRLQRFGSQGNLVGNEIALTRPGYDVRLAAYPAGGGFVLAWVESFGFFLETDVRALRLDSSAQPIGTAAARANVDVVRRNGYHYAPVPVVHPDGGFSVVWTTRIGTLLPQSLGIYARRYGADGQPAGLVRQVSEGYGIGDWKGNAVALPSGKVMVLWYEQRTGDVDGGTVASLLAASWPPLGSSFRIN